MKSEQFVSKNVVTHNGTFWDVLRGVPHGIGGNFSTANAYEKSSLFEGKPRFVLGTALSRAGCATP